MAVTVLLKDIVEALAMQLDEYESYLDLDTGQVAHVSSYLLRHADESDDEPDDLPDWQKPEWQAAKRVMSTDRMISLPTKFDIHEWQIMSDFSQSVQSARVRDELQHAIHGSGAFRHFKSTIRRHGVEKDWFAFRDNALREIAIEWCKENDIAWR